MNLFKLFFIIFCILLFFPSAKLQNVTTTNSTTILTNGTNMPTYVTTTTTTNTSTPSGSTYGTNVSTVAATTKAPTTSNPINSTNMLTATTVNKTNTSMTTSPTYGANVSTYITTAAFALTNSPAITGQYRSRVKIICSFNDTFLPDYYNSKSQILYSYLLNIFTKLSTALPKETIQLRRLVVYTVTPGSVVVNMRADLLSAAVLSDSVLLNVVQKGILTAFINVNILQISVVLSSTPVKPTSNSWIAGLVILVILAIIFIIIALFLCNRYFPRKFCCCLRNNNASTTTERVDNVELEYDNRYHDKYPIVG